MKITIPNTLEMRWKRISYSKPPTEIEPGNYTVGYITNLAIIGLINEIDELLIDWKLQKFENKICRKRIQ